MGEGFKHTEGELIVSLEAVNYTREIEIFSGRKQVATINTMHYKDKGEALANANRIVKSWNSHDELLEALESVAKYLHKQDSIEAEALLMEAQTAINKAEGKGKS